MNHGNALRLDQTMNRRRFVSVLAASAGLAPWLSPGKTPRESPRVMTVMGPISPERLGSTLTHEHVLVDFIGADKVGPGRYSRDEALRVILPFLTEARRLGCRSFVECTPSYIGKDPELLRQLSASSRLYILTNTGYYGAADNKFLPAHAYSETAEQLSQRWGDEWLRGIAGTGIRPGFIKLGVGGPSLSELHRKLVRAAALTHLNTGLTIASHTGPAALAREQIAILRELRVAPSAFIWVHAQTEKDLGTCLEVATLGCWVSYDGYAKSECERYVAVVREFKKDGRLGQLLLSHDAGWYRPGEPGGGEFRGYTEIYTSLVPALKAAGVSKRDLKLLLETNPAKAFTIGERLI